MTRACPVEVHVCCSSRIRQRFPKCHGLAPWRLTLVATKASDDASLDATGLPRGGSRLLLLKHLTTLPWMPRACPVELHVGRKLPTPEAANVRLHPARGWHLHEVGSRSFSSQRETPPRKGVASSRSRQPFF